jgi:hypothetical protein
MMARTQVTLEPELRKLARSRAGDLGVSFAEYIRRLVLRDLAAPSVRSTPSCLFDLGSSSGSDIAREKDSMLGHAFASSHSLGER